MAKNITPPLTPNELKVLEFVETHIVEQGFSPSFQEIKTHFGFASYNSVQRYVKQLQDKGYLSVPGENQKRALQVLRHSRSYLNLLKINSAETTDNLVPKQPIKKETLLAELSPPHVESLSLPLLGKVAAGAPIEAFEHDEYVEVPASLIRTPAKTFALSVQGQSMIEDGILDGDIIFVQKQTYARNGETIVAMINNQATVKRFYLHNEVQDIHKYPQVDAHLSVELRPANSSMESMWFAPDDIEIQGIVVGLIRRF